MEIHLLALLNNGGGARTAKKYPLDSVTENLMDAVRHALSSSEHIVALRGETDNPSCRSSSCPPSAGAVAGVGANGICRIPAGNWEWARAEGP